MILRCLCLSVIIEFLGWKNCKLKNLFLMSLLHTTYRVSRRNAALAFYCTEHTKNQPIIFMQSALCLFVVRVHKKYTMIVKRNSIVLDQ